MKQLTLLFLLVFILSGCSHLSVSNTDLLKNTDTETSYAKQDLKEFPLEVTASMSSCYESRSGANMIKRTCTNRGRLNDISSIFEERGLRAVPAKNTLTAPHLSVTTEEIGGFYRKFTVFFNIITLGLSPMYYYDDYMVTYTDPVKNIEISKKVRVSSTRSWFSLFQSNPENLDRKELKALAEKNLIKSVLDEANVGK